MVVVFLTIKIVHELICIVLRFFWNISMGSKIQNARGGNQDHLIFQRKIKKNAIKVNLRD